MFHHTLFQTAGSPLHHSSVKYYFTQVWLWQTRLKYLGVTLDTKLTHKHHISKLLCTANHRLRQLYPILNKCSPIIINLALTIYKTLIRSALTNAALAWGHAAKTLLEKVQIFHNKVLRMIIKLPRVTPTETLTLPNTYGNCKQVCC
jgi:hypothetical protein